MSVAQLTPRQKREYRAAYLMIAPMVVGIVVFFIIPTIWSIYLSFTEGPDYVTYSFVGIKNYLTLLSSGSDMWQELLNTFYYAFVSVALSMVISVLLANALNKDIKCRSLFRVIYFLPSVTMAAAIGMVWRSLLNSQYGIVNQALKAIGIAGPKWLTDPNFMMLGVIIVGVWSSAGYNMIILLAGLKNIPRVYYEAAEIDGANARQQFFHITVPMVSPTLFFVVLMRTMTSLKQFDTVYLLVPARTNPAYRSAATLMTVFYREAFEKLNRGYASAIVVFSFVLISIFTVIQLVAEKKLVHYDT